MGCRKLTYYEAGEGIEKSPLKILGAPEEKIPSLIFCNNYTPFGLTFNSYKRITAEPNKHLYQNKELQTDLDLETYDFHARMYDPLLGRTWQMDPHSDSYYDLSPYSWAANNPLTYLDPDGQDIIIWYENEDGKRQSFRFNGNNMGDAPDNKFVQQFFSSYYEMYDNSTGDNIRGLAENSDVTVNLAQGDRSEHSNGTIYWNPEAGLETDDGNVLSPSTVLEHEADHANQFKTNRDQHYEDTKTESPGFKNKEEERVIKGSETRTARALGEIGANNTSRNNHGGTTVITGSSTSNTTNRQKTYQYYMRLAKESNNPYYKKAYQERAAKYKD